MNRVLETFKIRPGEERTSALLVGLMLGLLLGLPSRITRKRLDSFAKTSVQSHVLVHESTERRRRRRGVSRRECTKLTPCSQRNTLRRRGGDVVLRMTIR